MTGKFVIDPLFHSRFHCSDGYRGHYHCRHCCHCWCSSQFYDVLLEIGSKVSSNFLVRLCIMTIYTSYEGNEAQICPKTKNNLRTTPSKNLFLNTHNLCHENAKRTESKIFCFCPLSFSFSERIFPF